MHVLKKKDADSQPCAAATPPDQHRHAASGRHAGQQGVVGEQIHVPVRGLRHGGVRHSGSLAAVVAALPLLMRRIRLAEN